MIVCFKRIMVGFDGHYFILLVFFLSTQSIKNKNKKRATIFEVLECLRGPPNFDFLFMKTCKFFFFLI